MTRIIAGRWGGRRIATPSGSGTRPTTDRVREAVFSSVESAFGGLDGLRVLDLFAGSGALGLEALSRGAVSADLVEHDARAAAVIAANVRTLGAGASATVHKVAAATFLARVADSGPRWDLAFLDPPYPMAMTEVHDVLRSLDPLLEPDGLVVLERGAREDFVWPAPLAPHRDRRYGEARVWYGR